MQFIKTLLILFLTTAMAFASDSVDRNRYNEVLHE